MSLDLSKQLKTRSGLEVKIYSTAAGGAFPIHGAVQEHTGKWSISSWTLKGKMIAVTVPGHSTDHAWDLVNVPASLKAKRWIKVLKGADGKLYFSNTIYYSKPTTMMNRVIDVLEFDLEWAEVVEGQPAPGDEIVDLDKDIEIESEEL